MNHSYIINRLSENAAVFKTLVENIPDEQARWKPAEDKWSILEVVNHLYDEEREDFRARLRYLLFEPETKWPAIDPVGWVKSRDYEARELLPSLNNFLEERRQSIEWLNNLSPPNWLNSYEHPMGIITAEQMLANWLAHDFLHIRQLNKLHFRYLENHVAPLSLNYAGPW